MKRKDIYKIIDAERDYQDALSPVRTDGHVHTVGEEIVLITSYLNKAIEAWSNNAGDAKALDVIVKLAAICVRCLESNQINP